MCNRTDLPPPVDNCKERFRNIRTSFARSINVQRVTNRVKPYYLSEELEFLKRHITPGVPVPVKGRRSRDSSNRRGDENDEYDENDEDEPVEALVHIKHSLSSDEYVTEEGSSSEWVTDDAHAQEKPDESELHSQSDDDGEEEEEEEQEQKPTNLLLQQAVNAAAATRACSSYPPKKRRRMVAELPAKASEVSTVRNVKRNSTNFSLSLSPACCCRRCCCGPCCPQCRHLPGLR